MSSTTTTTVTTSATTTSTTTIQPDLIHEVIDRQCARLDNGHRWIAPEDLGPLLYGIVQGTQYRITFYVSYSTWDGRFLYVDNVMMTDRNDDGMGTVEAGLKLLARIALDLGCSRFVRKEVWLEK
jgi:hypothetical protein